MFCIGKPSIGMGTLEILLAELRSSEQEFSPKDIFFPMVDARRMEVYTRPFNVKGISLEETAPLNLLARMVRKSSYRRAHRGIRRRRR